MYKQLLCGTTTAMGMIITVIWDWSSPYHFNKFFTSPTAVPTVVPVLTQHSTTCNCYSCNPLHLMLPHIMHKAIYMAITYNLYFYIVNVLGNYKVQSQQYHTEVFLQLDTIDSQVLNSTHLMITYNISNNYYIISYSHVIAIQLHNLAIATIIYKLCSY